MKKVFTTVFAMVLPMLASAHYGDADAKVGDIYYQLNKSDMTAMVTYKTSYDAHADMYYVSDYSGNLVIPGSFVYEGVTYTVTEIDQHAFEDCTGLISVEIPNTVTIIRDAFEGCTNLSSLTIPNSVTSISSYYLAETPWYNNQPDGLVYAGCVAYRYKGTMPENTNLILKDGTVGIAKIAFADCSNLISVTIPNGVKVIGERAFENCKNLSSVNIPSGMTSIGYSAFSGTSLTSIIIPSSVTTLGGCVFWDCDNLLSITSYITEPYTVGSGFFSENTYRKGSLTVPANTKELYSRFDGWKEFLKIVEMNGIVYNLSIQDSSNGTIDMQVKDGTTFSLKITPKDGKTIKNVYFNDDDVTSQLDSEKNYTTPAITANSTLRIVYKGDKRGDLNDDDKVDVADHVELTKIIMNQE